MPHLSFAIVLLAALPLLSVATGCNGSRWARSDPKYARKYDHHTDDAVRTVKEAIDARHLEGRGGFYGDVAVQNSPAAVGASGGYFQYLPRTKGMVSAHGGLSLLAGENNLGLTGGVDAGMRIQLPTRLAPFIGAGIYAGMLPDLFQSDEDDIFRDPADQEDESEFAAAAYPELGIHFWATPQWRLTTSLGYYVPFSSIGEAEEFAMLRVGLARMNIPGWMGRGHYAGQMAAVDDFASHIPPPKRKVGERVAAHSQVAPRLDVPAVQPLLDQPHEKEDELTSLSQVQETRVEAIAEPWEQPIWQPAEL